jgi:hypothetical protein
MIFQALPYQQLTSNSDAWCRLDDMRFTPADKDKTAVSVKESRRHVGLR